MSAPPVEDGADHVTEIVPRTRSTNVMVGAVGTVAGVSAVAFEAVDDPAAFVATTVTS